VNAKASALVLGMMPLEVVAQDRTAQASRADYFKCSTK